MKKIWIVIGLLVVLNVLVYGQTRSFEFVNVDDDNWPTFSAFVG